SGTRIPLAMIPGPFKIFSARALLLEASIPSTFFLRRRKREDFSYERAKEHMDYQKTLEVLSRCVDYAKRARQCLGDLELEYVPVTETTMWRIDNPQKERFSERVNKFWMTISEELTNDKIKNKENEYDLTSTTNVNKQMGTYVNATTSRLTKRFLECAKESLPKRVAKNLMEDDRNNPLIVSGTSDGNDSDKSYHPRIKKSSLSEGAKKWVIDTLDVSSLLLEYRDISVQRASENKIEEVAEIL
ncbi:3461_t:CDS:2, partial [Acaulospora morrowiae]